MKAVVPSAGEGLDEGTVHVGLAVSICSKTLDHPVGRLVGGFGPQFSKMNPFLCFPGNTGGKGTWKLVITFREHCEDQFTVL